MESCSVASPISPASGTMASAEAQKMAIGLAPYQSNPSASGINTSSQFRLMAIRFPQTSKHQVASGRPFEKQQIVVVTKQRVQVTDFSVTVGPAGIFQIQNADLVLGITLLYRLEHRCGAVDGSICGIDKFSCVQNLAIGDADFVSDLKQCLVDLGLGSFCRHFGLDDAALVPVKNRKRHTQAKGPLLLVVWTVWTLNRVSELCRHVRIGGHSGQLQLGLSSVANEPERPNIRAVFRCILHQIAKFQLQRTVNERGFQVEFDIR